MAFTTEDTMQKTKAVIVEKLSVPIENITPESTLKDLGADSLDIVEMVMTFEEVFGTEIKDEDAEKITTVKEAADYLHAARTKQQPMKRHRVVITGIGLVTPVGNSTSTSWDAVISGKSGITKVDFDTSPHASAVAGRVVNVQEKINRHCMG